MNLTIQTIDPRDITPTEWCDRMVLELDRFGTIPVIMADEDWKQWGRETIQLSEISVFNPPDPETYDEFEDWALDFNDAVFAGD